MGGSEGWANGTVLEDNPMNLGLANAQHIGPEARLRKTERRFKRKASRHQGSSNAP